jgi:serine O-acetyltransferase
MRYQRIRSVAVSLRDQGVPLLPQLIGLTIRALFAAEIPLDLNLPPGVVLMHNALGVVMHPDVKFEGPAIIFQGVTLGNSWGQREGVPRLGGHVMIGAGASVLGPVHIGEFSVVGAGAVVTDDVPAGHLAVGNPPRLLPADRGHLEKLFRFE